MPILPYNYNSDPYLSLWTSCNVYLVLHTTKQAQRSFGKPKCTPTTRLSFRRPRYYLQTPRKLSRPNTVARLVVGSIAANAAEKSLNDFKNMSDTLGKYTVCRLNARSAPTSGGVPIK